MGLFVDILFRRADVLAYKLLELAVICTLNHC